jgi:O-antigen/teichoic acid export membrane protein
LIGEQSTRLLTGAVLAAAGLGVTGAYLGTPLSFVAMGLYCTTQLRRYAASEHHAAPAGEPAPEAALGLWTHVTRAWAPIAGLIVIAVLQNIDIIAAKHRFTKDLASSYAATAVAAKVLVWVAMGASFYLVPEVSRRRAAGEDPRPVLARALAIILVCAVPVLMIFGFGARPLLRIAFGPHRLGASSSLFVLGVAFTVLASTYLAIQYMLALKRTWFLILVGAVAVIEPVLLLQASRRPGGFAAVVLGVQALGALLAFALALRRDGPQRATAISPEPA